jgi:hypothetical protein
MEKKTVRKVNELQDDARRVLERLLDQRLASDDRVAVIVLPAARSGADTAWRRLERTLDRMAARARHVPDDEVESAIDEAMEHVRRRKR